MVVKVIDTMADDKHHKKRVSKACDCCRKSKTKCDGQRPCTRCLQDGKICTYMNKKKVDQMYPASYVDLLETRVSILVQSLTQLLNKSKGSIDELQDFIQDPSILNSNGDFDINKVICHLLPEERLDNIAESTHDYSLDEITNVTRSSVSRSRSPSPRASHHTLAKVRRNSENHIHKIPLKRHSDQNSLSSSSTSLQSRLSLNTTTSPTSESPLSSASLDLKTKRNHTLDSILYPQDALNELDLENVNFSDSNTTLMSPVYSIEELDQNGGLDTNFNDLFSRQVNPFIKQEDPYIKQENPLNKIPNTLDNWASFNLDDGRLDNPLKF